MSRSVNRLIILSGPSCVGKSPLAKALARIHPDLNAKLQPLVLYNSRTPRPGERDGIDYHFRPGEEIETFRSDERFAVLDVRGDTQALRLDDLERLLDTGDVLFEGNPMVGGLMQTHPALADLPRLSAFVSPLSRTEILDLRDRTCLSDLVNDVMRRKLLRRTRKQKGELALPDLQNIEKRAGSAYAELRIAHTFDHIIPNHDGEDSDNWDAFYYPLGDARKALAAFVALLTGQVTQGVEKWEADLLPQD